MNKTERDAFVRELGLASEYLDKHGYAKAVCSDQKQQAVSYEYLALAGRLREYAAALPVSDVEPRIVAWRPRKVACYVDAAWRDGAPSEPEKFGMDIEYAYAAPPALPDGWVAVPVEHVESLRRLADIIDTKARDGLHPETIHGWANEIREAFVTIPEPPR